MACPVFMMLGRWMGWRCSGGSFTRAVRRGLPWRRLGVEASEDARRYDELLRGLEEKCAGRRRSESPYVALARQAVEEYVRHHKVVHVPEPLPEGMDRAAGVFCSIHKGGQLRGCIGTTEPVRANIALETTN